MAAASALSATGFSLTVEAGVSRWLAVEGFSERPAAPWTAWGFAVVETVPANDAEWTGTGPERFATSPMDERTMIRVTTAMPNRRDRGSALIRAAKQVRYIIALQAPQTVGANLLLAEGA